MQFNCLYAHMSCHLLQQQQQQQIKNATKVQKNNKNKAHSTCV